MTRTGAGGWRAAAFSLGLWGWVGGALAQPAPVVERGPSPAMMSRVFDVRHRQPKDLARTVQLLGSGVAGSAIDRDDQRRTLTVRDFPDCISHIEKALARFDVPAPPRAQLDVELQAFLARKGAGPEPATGVRAALLPLRAELGARSFVPVVSVGRRVAVGAEEDDTGEAMFTAGPAGNGTRVRYRYRLKHLAMRRGARPEDARVDGGRVQLLIEGEGVGKTEIRTGLTLREGEPTVVGTAPFADGTLVVVISARVAP